MIFQCHSTPLLYEVSKSCQTSCYILTVSCLLEEISGTETCIDVRVITRSAARTPGKDRQRHCHKIGLCCHSSQVSHWQCIREYFFLSACLEGFNTEDTAHVPAQDKGFFCVLLRTCQRLPNVCFSMTVFLTGFIKCFTCAKNSPHDNVSQVPV